MKYNNLNIYKIILLKQFRSINSLPVLMRIKSEIFRLPFNKINHWMVVLAILVSNTTISAQTAAPANSFFLHPYKKNAIFSNKSQVGFMLKVQSSLSDRQRGSIALEIKNIDGKSVYHDNIGVFINPQGSYSKELDFGRIGLMPGAYSLFLNMTTNAGSSIGTFSFLVDPDKVAINQNRPADFNSFWEEAVKELYTINPNYQYKKRSDLSNSGWEVYEVSFQSLDNITIKSYLSIPNKKGHFPVTCMFCDYLTELKPQYEKERAVMSVNVRGVGLSKGIYKTDFSQYLNLDENNRKKFIYRGVYMDGYRSVDFLFKFATSLGLDSSKILLKGVGQGAGLCAAIGVLLPKAKGIIMERPLFVDVRSLIANAESTKVSNFPANAMMAYYNSHIYGMNKEVFLKNWEYFDPINFAPYISCPILYGFTYKSNQTPSICNHSFIGQLRNGSEDILLCTECADEMDTKFYGFQNTWINEVLNIP